MINITLVNEDAKCIRLECENEEKLTSFFSRIKAKDVALGDSVYYDDELYKVAAYSFIPLIN